MGGYDYPQETLITAKGKLTIPFQAELRHPLPRLQALAGFQGPSRCPR